MKCNHPNNEMVAAKATKATKPNPAASAMPLFHAPVIKERGTKNACHVGHWLPLADEFEICDPPMSVANLCKVNCEECQRKMQLQFHCYDAKFASLMEQK